MKVVAQHPSIFEKYGINISSFSKPDMDESEFSFLAASEIENVFQYLNGHEIASLMKLAEIKMFNSGAKILRQGEAADALYVVIDGETCEVNNGGRTVKYFNKGVYGITSLLENHPENVDVFAYGDVLAIKMSREILTKLMRFNLYFAERLKTCLKNYFRENAGEFGHLAS